MRERLGSAWPPSLLARARHCLCRHKGRVLLIARAHTLAAQSISVKHIERDSILDQPPPLAAPTVLVNALNGNHREHEHEDEQQRTYEHPINGLQSQSTVEPAVTSASAPIPAPSSMSTAAIMAAIRAGDWLQLNALLEHLHHNGISTTATEAETILTAFHSQLRAGSVVPTLRLKHCYNALVHILVPHEASLTAATFDAALTVAHRLSSTIHLRYFFSRLLRSSHRTRGRHWSWLIQSYHTINDASSLITITEAIVAWNAASVRSQRVELDSPARAALIQSCVYLGHLETAERLIHDRLANGDRLTISWGEYVRMIDIYERQRRWSDIVALWQLMMGTISPSHTVTRRLAVSVIDAFVHLGLHSHLWTTWRWMCEQRAQVCSGKGVEDLGAPLWNAVIESCIKAELTEQICIIGDVVTNRSSIQALVDQSDQPAQQPREREQRQKLDAQFRRRLTLYYQHSEQPSLEPTPLPPYFNTRTFTLLASHYNSHDLYGHTLALHQTMSAQLPQPLPIEIFDLVIEGLVALAMHAQLTQTLSTMLDANIALSTHTLAHLARALSSEPRSSQSLTMAAKLWEVWRHFMQRDREQNLALLPLLTSLLQHEPVAIEIAAAAAQTALPTRPAMIKHASDR